MPDRMTSAVISVPVITLLEPEVSPVVVTISPQNPGSSSASSEVRELMTGQRRPVEAGPKDLRTLPWGASSGPDPLGAHRGGHHRDAGTRAILGWPERRPLRTRMLMTGTYSSSTAECRRPLRCCHPSPATHAADRPSPIPRTAPPTRRTPSRDSTPPDVLGRPPVHRRSRPPTPPPPPDRPVCHTRPRSCAGTSDSSPATGHPPPPARRTSHPRRTTDARGAPGHREPDLGLPARPRRTRRARLPAV